MSNIDHDLEFLRRCPNEELKKLCDYLTFDGNGCYRISEQLTDTDAYICNYPDNMRKMTAELAEELQKYGSNTVVTFINGYPDSYQTVVRRVCKKMKAEVTPWDDAVTMERALLQKVCETALSHMSDDEIQELADEIGLMKKDLRKQMTAATVLLAMKRFPKVFYRVVNYVVTRVLALIGGRAAASTGAKLLERVFGVATGPVGWIVMTAWTIWDIAAPAYRVIVPAVMHVAAMRFAATPNLGFRGRAA